VRVSGEAANSNGCFIRPGGEECRQIGQLSLAANQQIQQAGMADTT